MHFFMVAVSFALFVGHANALGVSDLTNTEANNGLKAALTQAAGKAVSQLSATDGFLGNNEVKIPLPDTLKKAERTMRLLGMGKQTDELVLRINRAAEAAVPEAKALLVDSVKKMSVADAKAILTGGDDAATQYFKKHTAEPMSEKFLPIVKKATEDVQLAQQYNKFAEMGNKVGLVKKEQVNLEQYVTQKTLDGVYLMMAKEESAIRKDPVGQTSSLLKKVFGALY
ncbi:MAG: DUF4197 domain-containing protein [Methylotenera sp.]|nr:DUF4197 domain-containing protein [Methylotenera sp.]MDP1754651.1 DUF4197 domain-containing protein [Methylotenera sp.]MDP1959249.1 DUF4197 domain-containing protein [Methylotenera sp.]MDP3303100.1 DUF4197 domain-containing protein [Methylotenera sp.]MDP3943889.1 DUF4197 domain-containing protein [Methylotenera sp.]